MKKTALKERNPTVHSRLNIEPLSLQVSGLLLLTSPRFVSSRGPPLLSFLSLNQEAGKQKGITGSGRERQRRNKEHSSEGRPRWVKTV